MEKETKNTEIINSEKPIFLDVKKAEDSEIKEVFEKTPDGLFVDLVERTWSDFVEKNFHKELKNNKEALSQRKVDTMKTFFNEGFEALDENLDKKIVEYLRNNGALLHIPNSKRSVWYAPQEIHEAVLTSAHTGIISPDEQEALKNDVSVVVAGVSVGASVVKALTKLGIGNILGFDPKDIGVNHLSRIDTLATNVGRSKAQVMDEDIKLLNPYANWKIEAKSFKSKEFDTLWEKDTPLKIVVDMIDDADEKSEIRKLALKEKNIVLMVTDLGNGRIILDIDDFRFSNTKAFGGKLDLMNAKALSKWEAMTSTQKVANIVGIKNLNRDMMDALPGILKGEYASFPQLGLTSQIAGGVVANTLLNMVRGIEMKSRSIVDINKVNHKTFNYLERESFGKYLSLLKNVKLLKK